MFKPIPHVDTSLRRVDQLKFVDQQVVKKRREEVCEQLLKEKEEREWREKAEKAEQEAKEALKKADALLGDEKEKKKKADKDVEKREKEHLSVSVKVKEEK